MLVRPLPPVFEASLSDPDPGDGGRDGTYVGEEPGQVQRTRPAAALRTPRRGRRGPAGGRPWRGATGVGSPAAMRLAERRAVWRCCSAASSSPCSRRTSASPTWRSPVVESGTPGCRCAVVQGPLVEPPGLRRAAAGRHMSARTTVLPELVGHVPGRAQAGDRFRERVHRDLRGHRPPTRPGRGTRRHRLGRSGPPARPARARGARVRRCRRRHREPGRPRRGRSRSTRAASAARRPRVEARSAGACASSARSASTQPRLDPVEVALDQAHPGSALPSTGRRRTTSSGSACSHSRSRGRGAGDGPRAAPAR